MSFRMGHAVGLKVFRLLESEQSMAINMQSLLLKLDQAVTRLADPPSEHR